jgi:hypothetical protein
MGKKKSRSKQKITFEIILMAATLLMTVIQAIIALLK